MKAYRIVGKFLMKDIWQPFKKEIIGENEDDARERILSIIGSRHKVKRRMIKIDKIVELKFEEIEDPLVKYILEKGGKNE